MSDNVETISVRIVEEYYNNNIQMFIDYMHDDIIWIGPAINHYIESKQCFIDAFAKEKNILLFRTSQMSSKKVKGTTPSTCEVLLNYIVHSYYPNNNILTHYQRVTMFWKKVKKDDRSLWKIALIHVSNGMETDNRDNIYPLHLDEFEQKRLKQNFTDLYKQQKERLTVKGFDGATYYIEYTDIQYIYAGKGKFCYVHTVNGEICVRMLLDQLMKILPKQFYRPHRSYIVNIFEIVKLSRPQIILKDNTKIPISQKKFTKTQSDIEEILNQINYDISSNSEY